MVIWILSIAAGVAAVGVAVPCAVFAAEVLLALLPPRRPVRTQGPEPSVAVLIPAHNEEGTIGATVARLVAQGAARVLVVADNCTDATAREAASAGALVAERDDPARRGKGYALAFGVERLREDPPDVIVVIDADCQAEDGAVAALARQAHTHARPAQAEYLMRPPDRAGPGDRVSALAFAFKNVVRPRGLARIGAPCLLTGSGMALPRALAEPSHLATGDIVEDMRLGIDLARSGHPPVACPGARVWSTLPAADAGRRSQRTRWEHGHLASIARFVPGLLLDAVRRGRPGLLALSLELSVPPLSLLLLLTVASAGLALAAALAGGWAWPAWTAGAALAALAAAFALGWWRFGRAVLPGRELWGVFPYALAKVPIYLRALTSRQTEWVRTPRDAG